MSWNLDARLSNKRSVVERVLDQQLNINNCQNVVMCVQSTVAMFIKRNARKLDKTLTYRTHFIIYRAYKKLGKLSHKSREQMIY